MNSIRGEFIRGQLNIVCPRCRWLMHSVFFAELHRKAHKRIDERAKGKRRKETEKKEEKEKKRWRAKPAVPLFREEGEEREGGEGAEKKAKQESTKDA